MAQTAGGSGTDSPPSADRVDLIRVDLHPPPSLVARYRTLLSDEECERADRFVTADLTRRFTVCRAVLRLALANHLDRRPSDIAFLAGPHGKPYLTETNLGCEFNVSHTSDVALIAIAQRRPLGVDVETVSERVSRDELTSQFFSLAEREAYFALAEPLRLAAFFRIWTCKEAFLKATGLGLSFPLGRFSVSVPPHDPPGLVQVRDDDEAPRRWSFVLPNAGTGFAAALAVEGHGWTLSYRDWDHHTSGD